MTRRAQRSITKSELSFIDRYFAGRISRLYCAKATERSLFLAQSSTGRRWRCSRRSRRRPREFVGELLFQDGVEHFVASAGEILDAFPELRGGARLVEHSSGERFAARTATVEAVKGALFSQAEVDVSDVELLTDALQGALF